MMNLTGNKDCDRQIGFELRLAGIDVKHAPDGMRNTGEVPYSIWGELGRFVFTRAWYYWAVEGPMPYEVAKEIFKTTIGKETVRASGDCGCILEDHMAKWLDDDGWELLEMNEELQSMKDRGHLGNDTLVMMKWRIVEDKTVGTFCIDSYHIDTQEGLDFFVAKLREHNLVPASTPV